MPRRGKIKKKRLKADPFYNSTLISKFINTVMKEGKKNLAENIIYGSMELVKKKRTHGLPWKQNQEG
jgi:small subunit ribosomal protein S7